MTSVQHFAYDAVDVELLDGFRRTGTLPIRVHVSLPLDGDVAAYAALRDRVRDPMLRVVHLKGYVDGVIESRTAYMLEPFAGGRDRGAPLVAPGELRRLVSRAHRHGFGVALHAIGDAGVRASLAAFAAARPRIEGMRDRIEHLEVVHPRDVARFAKLDVVASMQPYHAVPGDSAEDDAGPWTDNLGPERLPRAFPWRDLQDAGATLAFGSDWPVMDAEPTWGLAVAITRRNENGLPAGGWQAHQALTAEQAVAAYTSGPAWSVGREGELGCLEVGCRADFTVLGPAADLDDPASLWEAGVRATFVGGVWEKR